MHWARQPCDCKTNETSLTKSNSKKHETSFNYIAGSNRSHPPTSPSNAPATKSRITICDTNPMKRHLHASSTIRTWFEHDLNTTSSSRTPLVRKAYFYHLGDAVCVEEHSISRSGYLPIFLANAALKSDAPTSPNTVPATKSATSPNIFTCHETSQCSGGGDVVMRCGGETWWCGEIRCSVMWWCGEMWWWNSVTRKFLN